MSLAVSVVVPARNAATTLGLQLRALAAQRGAPAFEVLVVDDASTDGTADVAGRHERMLPRLRVVRQQRRGGANAARNRGVDAATGALVLLCDADDRVASGWVAAMVAGLTSAPLVGGRMVERRPPPWRGALTPGRLPTALEALPYAIGGNLGFRRGVWESVGGFDETFRIGATEVELCWRAQLQGFALAYQPDAVVHYRAKRGLAALQQAWRWGRGSARLIERFGPSGVVTRGAVTRRGATLRSALAVCRQPLPSLAYLAGLTGGAAQAALGLRL